MANRRPNFQLPDAINPPGRRCIQIMIPDDPQHIHIFAGLTRQLLDWQRWERDPLKRGTEVAQVWRDVWNSIDWTGEDCMGCCPQPTNRRYNSEGQLEVSYDGGITWSLAPDADDRYSGIVSPPLAGADGDEKRCTGSASAMEFVKQNLIDELSSGSNYADIYAAAVALAAVLGVTGIGILIATAAAAIFIAGVSAVQAAFTTEVWGDFQCILYCNSEDDASFTEAGWERVKADILSTFTGVVSAVLYNWVNSVGIVGLTNAARSGFATAPDCSSCECVPTCANPDNFTVGNVTGQVENPDGSITFTVVSVIKPDMTYAIEWGEVGASGDNCCSLTDVEIISGGCAGVNGCYSCECGSAIVDQSAFLPSWMLRVFGISAGRLPYSAIYCNIHFSGVLTLHRQEKGNCRTVGRQGL